MLQKADEDRREKVLNTIEALGIRFPVAHLVNIMGVDKGMVSSYLRGKKPISDNFYTKFVKEFGLVENEDDVKSRKSDEIAVLKIQVKELTRALAQLNETVTKRPALDFYLELEKRMKSELIEQSGVQSPS